MAINVVAVLSTTVVRSGTYKVAEVSFSEVALEGVPSYCGHPDTAALLEAFGVKQLPKGSNFDGLAIGESYLAVPLKIPARAGGWTVDVAVAELGELRPLVVTRVE